MKEQGLFRTKLFGGFNKKDVFEYFEVLKSQVADESSEIVSENAQLKEQLAKKDAQIQSLTSELQMQTDMGKKAQTFEAEVSTLRAKNEELQDALDEMLGYKSRCDELSRKVLKIESELMLSATKAKKYENSYSRLKSQVDAIPDLPENTFENAKEALGNLTSSLCELNRMTEVVLKAKSGDEI